MSVDRQRFTATLQRAAGGGSTFVVLPDSVKLGAARGTVQVRGTIDGLAFRSTFTVMGAGHHRLTVRPDICRRLGKGAGDRVTVVVHRPTGSRTA